MNTAQVKELYEQYILPTYAQAPVCLVKGKGSRVWDLENREYIDFFPGWAVSGLGHCQPDVVNAVKHQARKIMHISNNFFNLKQARLAEALSKVGFPARAFFCNSGAEANEAAIKFARKYGNKTGRNEIITMKLSFHGRTMAGISATGQEKVRDGFEPLLTGFRYAEFNNLISVAEQVNEKTIAIMLEPIQGEGGIQVATQEFMQGLRELCNEKKLLLILDEVQTCMGRTGKMFAYQHYNIEPCVMTLAKSLGNGLPIGAMLANKRISEEVMVPGSHGSTYGGNPLVAAGALAVIETIQRKKLLASATRLGEYFEKKLLKLKDKFDVIEEVRGIGMMRALKLKSSGVEIAKRAMENGLLINCTQDKILRIMPAITISKTLLDQGLGILEKCLEN